MNIHEESREGIQLPIKHPESQIFDSYAARSSKSAAAQAFATPKPKSTIPTALMNESSFAAQKQHLNFANTTLSRADDPYELDTVFYTWIVISGFTNNSLVTNELIHRFQRHGDIIDYEIGQGNWMFIRFATAMQADQAATRENNQLFHQGTLLAVLPLTHDLARKLHFQHRLTIESAGVGSQVALVPTTSVDAMSRTGLLGASYRSHLSPAASGFEQYLQAPKMKKTNICRRIIEFFFSY
jgi:hypothetical protein